MFAPPVQLLWNPPAGTVIRVNTGLYSHVGLLGDRFINGERSVLSFSAEAKGFVEEPFSAFSGGRPVVCDGYLGDLPPEGVMWRARQKAGQPYSWLDFNCEHFVRYAHGVPMESPQLQQVGAIVGILGLAFFALKATRA